MLAHVLRSLWMSPGMSPVSRLELVSTGVGRDKGLV